MTGFNNYKKEIINAYQTLKQTGRLASDLENPSPAQLRDYCLELWANRYEKADEPIIKSFFDPGNRYNDLEAAIKQSDIDKLRPLINFMTKGIKNRDDRNVKLLAWLIDFRPRPYEVWREQRKSPLEMEIAEPIGPENPLPTDLPLSKKTSIKGVLMVSIISVATALGIYLFTSLKGKSNEHQCMYWLEDRYMTIDCQDKTIPAGITKIALDRHKLNTFVRITDPDTLTYGDIGKIWYTRITNDSLDFFTGPGNHPVQSQKHLKPMTKYIVDKHIYTR